MRPHRWWTKGQMEWDHLSAEAKAVLHGRPFDLCNPGARAPTSLGTDTSDTSDQFDVVTCDVDSDVARPSPDSTDE